MAARNNSSDHERKKNLIDTLYHHTHMSVESISYQVDMSINKVQEIVDDMRKKEGLEFYVSQSQTPVEKIMTRNVITLEHHKTVHSAAVLMSKNNIGSIVVTVKGKPFGIITERDMVKAIAKDDVSFKVMTLDRFASRPLIYASTSQTVEDVAKLMITNKIRRMPIMQHSKVVGIVTITDLVMFLSPARNSRITESIIHAISREKSKNDSHLAIMQ